MSETTYDPAWYLRHFRSDAEGLAAAVDAGPIDAAIASCPGWDVGDLVEHVGNVHRWAAFCAREGRPPGEDDDAGLGTYDRATAADWYRESASIVAETLDGIDPASPSWHPFSVERVAGFWPRRMAHETVIHRFDVEHAVGRSYVPDAELASDGIDEYFEVIVPRVLKTGAELPTGSFHVHCTDVEGEWLVWNEDGEYRMIRAHQKGDAALRGPAAQILLRLWNRPGPDDELSPVGDDATLTAWTSLGGN